MKTCQIYDHAPRKRNISVINKGKFANFSALDYDKKKQLFYGNSISIEDKEILNFVGKFINDNIL